VYSAHTRPHITRARARARTRLRHLGPLRLDPLHAILSVLTLISILLFHVELALARWRLGVGDGDGVGVFVFLGGRLVVLLIVLGVFALLGLPGSAGARFFRQRWIGRLWRLPFTKRGTAWCEGKWRRKVWERVRGGTRPRDGART
jgi:hypothetical protein